MRIASDPKLYPMRIPIRFPIIVVALWATASAGAYDAVYERPPINYPTAQMDDPVARLARRIASGEVRLAYDAKTGYLPALLKELRVPVSSQTLVFSKTSFQRELIGPDRPRALYFNDDVYVGYVKGGDVIEITSTDPNNGPVFYTVSQKEAGPEVPLKFARQS